MKIPLSTLRVAVIVILTISQFSILLANKEFNRKEIEKTLSNHSGLLKASETEETIDYIKSYLTYGRRNSEKLIGKTRRFFPLFEDYLQRYQLPDALKYLPMIESRLEPFAASTAGAAGLWQLMPSTARALGLTIDGLVDERKDPIKSTKAALRYLKKQYKRFGSWELALAAYNCGSGKVQKAIDKGGAKDFWKIKQYLPRETQKYITKFIAVEYFVNNYKTYDIKPRLPKSDLIYTRTIKTKEGLTFKELSEMTGVSKSIIKKLNPSYRRNLIPASEHGHFLTLPRKGLIAFKSFKKSEREQRENEIKNGPSKEQSEPLHAAVKIPDEVNKNCLVYQKNVEKLARKKILSHFEKTALNAFLLTSRKDSNQSLFIERPNFLITNRRRKAVKSVV